MIPALPDIHDLTPQSPREPKDTIVHFFSSLSLLFPPIKTIMALYGFVCHILFFLIKCFRLYFGFYFSLSFYLLRRHILSFSRHALCLILLLCFVCFRSLDIIACFTHYLILNKPEILKSSQSSSPCKLLSHLKPSPASSTSSLIPLCRLDTSVPPFLTPSFFSDLFSPHTTTHPSSHVLSVQRSSPFITFHAPPTYPPKLLRPTLTILHPSHTPPTHSPTLLSLRLFPSPSGFSLLPLHSSAQLVPRPGRRCGQIKLISRYGRVLPDTHSVTCVAGGTGPAGCTCGG